MKRWLIALAACSAEVHHTQDGGPLDVLPDVPVSSGEAPAGAVKLRVTQGGMAVPGVIVYFASADSMPIATAVTNDGGVAWAVMPAGGFVTARRRSGQFRDELTTFSSVQAGDALQLDIDPPTSTIATTSTLQLPAMAGAAAYKVYAPCDVQAVATTTADIALSGCTNPTDLVVVPLDAEGDPMGSALVAPGVAIDTGSINLQAYAYAPFAATTFSYTNVPASVQFLGVYGAVSAQHRAFEVTAGADVSGGTASTQLNMPTNAGTALTVTTEFPTSSEIGRLTIYNWHAATTTYGLDIASVQLPRYATAPVFADRKLTWTERSGGSEPDLVRAQIHAHRGGIPEGHAWKWRIVAPRTATTVTFPVLPVLDFDFNIKPTDTVGVDDLMTISLPGGYAGVRTQPFADVTRAISGTLGRIVTQTLYFEPL